jgi:hypothetical protein
MAKLSRPVPIMAVFAWCASTLFIGMFAWLAIMLVTMGPDATNAAIAGMLTGGGPGVMVDGGSLTPIVPKQPVIMNTATGEEQIVLV